MDARQPAPGWAAADVDLLAARILTLRRDIPAGQPLIVGIDGRSGAGKTTLAGQVVTQLTAAGCDQPDVVPLDRIYPGWDGLEAGVSLLADRVLAPLRHGQPASYPRWDWVRGRTMSRPATVSPGWCVIAEGVGSCARRCAAFLSLKVWVDAPGPTRYQRAMARDGATYRPHWDRWAAQERQHFGIERTPERADLWLGPERHRQGAGSPAQRRPR